MKKLSDLESAIESLLLVSDEPVTAGRLSEVSGYPVKEVKEALSRLEHEYLENNRGILLRKVAGGYRLYTHPGHSEKVAMLIETRKRRLTPAALETLSIIAYRQPVTRAQIYDIRGVNSDGVISSLSEKELIEEVGREDSPGQPILYGTTKKFFEDLGIDSLADLPALEQFEPDDDAKNQIIFSVSSSKIGVKDEGKTQ